MKSDSGSQSAPSRFIPHVLILVVAVFVSGCTTPSVRQYRADEEEKIREAVLLEYLAARDTNRIVFVSFTDSSHKYIDPSDAVIARIRAASIPVRKGSEAGTDNYTQVIEQESGRLGVIYYAGVLRWFAKSKIEAIEAPPVHRSAEDSLSLL